jgi:Methionine synthase I (cobalamin-dependent), methyltransferase domain
MPDLTEGRARPSPDLAPGLADGAEVLAALRAAADGRVLILDGAMGTQIQGLGFEEAQFRGSRFAAATIISAATTIC